MLATQRLLPRPSERLPHPAGCIPWCSWRREAQHPRRSDWPRRRPGKDASRGGGELPRLLAAEGGGCPRPEQGGATWWGAAEGCPGVRPSPFVCTPHLARRRSPLPKEGRQRGGGGRPGGREGERSGQGEQALWGLGEAARVEARPRRAAGAAGEGAEEKLRKETHPAPNTQVSPVTNRKVQPQEEVIGAVASWRSRERCERERTSERRKGSERKPTDRPTEPQRGKGGRR